MNGKTQLAIGIFLGIILTSLILGAYLLGTKNNDKTTQVEPSIVLSPTIIPKTSVAPTVELENKNTTGTITGSLNYPSEGIPDDLEVCANNTITNETVCTNDHVTSNEYQHGVGYELIVPAGSYSVYSKLPDSNYRAYYSEAVLCGLTIECTDHTPLVVKIGANQTVTANPHDWYDQSQQ